MATKKTTPPPAPADKDCQPPEPVKSRYDTVKKILDDAFSQSTADYQGNGKFWLLPRNEFLCLTIYGVRMISPELPYDPCDHIGNAGPTPPAARPTPQGSCCHGPDTTASVAPVGQPTSVSSSTPGRGAASGLIKALKGEYPYDGSLFPQMPWGAAPMPPASIAFVESWIDDGCLESDPPSATVTSDGAGIAARHSGQATQPPSSLPTNQFNGDAGLIKQRKNIECLTDEELCRLRNALLWMKSYDQYPLDDTSFHYWAQTHASNCQHGWEEFLTWHRIYLYLFEQKLQDFDPTVTLPYWDWTLYDQDWTTKSGVYDNGTIPAAYRCFVNDAVIASLRAQGVDETTLGKLEKINIKNGTQTPSEFTYNSGNRLFIAADIPYESLYIPSGTPEPPVKSTTRLIVDALQAANPLWYHNRWPGGNPNVIFESYPTSGDVENILKIPNFYNFGSGPDANHFFGAVENIHNLMHNFAGGMNPLWNAPYIPPAGADPLNGNEPSVGDMCNAAVTAYDPIFWAHHANVDRLWWEWQLKNPNVNPDDMDSSLQPWNLTVADSINISNLGYEYVCDSVVFPVTNTHVPFTAFVSEKTPLSPVVTNRHTSAEIRVHKMQPTMAGGGFIRFFINEPNANEKTPTKGNPNFVTQMALFSGHCIGGPGHCAPPKNVSNQGVRRKFDLRARSHKTPRNIHVDATAAVQRQLAQGKTDLHVSLVVLDLDGTLKPDTLKIDGVSLVFKD